MPSSVSSGSPSAASACRRGALVLAMRGESDTRRPRAHGAPPRATARPERRARHRFSHLAPERLDVVEVHAARLAGHGEILEAARARVDVGVRAEQEDR